MTGGYNFCNQILPSENPAGQSITPEFLLPLWQQARYLDLH